MPRHASAGLIASSILLSLASPAASQAAPAVAHPQAVSGPATQQTLTNAHAMSVKPMAPSVAAFHARVSPKLSPAARTWVASEAKVIAGRNLSAAQMGALAQQDAAKRFAGQGLQTGDIESIAICVMMQASSDAQNDLRDQLAQMQKMNQQKAAQRATTNAASQQQAALKDSLKNHNNELGDISTQQQLQLQMTMDRMNQFEETLSNLMKKNADTESAILGNLK